MKSSIIHKINLMRNNNDISDDDIYNEIAFRDEKKQLKFLFNETLSKRNKEELTKYCINKGLIGKDSNFIKIHENLYQFRNSLVHAKEEKDKSAIYPDPFETNLIIEKWIFVTGEIALKCIKKYNQKL